MGNEKRYRVRAVSVAKETPDTWTTKFAFVDEKPFDYVVGQYVMFYWEGPDLEGNNKVHSRAYSMSSSPTETAKDGLVAFTVKRKENGLFSKMLTQEKTGYEFEISGPQGHFTFEEDKVEHAYFLGAGSGAAPLLAMLQYVYDKKLKLPCKYYSSDKTMEDILFRERLAALAKAMPNLEVGHTLTREEGGWDGETGRVDEEKLKAWVSDPAKGSFFLCGPPLMIVNIKKMLMAMGVPRERIKTELYD